MKRPIALSLALFAAAGPFCAPAPAAGAPAGERRAELLNLVRQDCGSCHGLTMKGGLGPPLLPETLRERDATSLEATVLYGRPGTPMPPWKDFMTEQEATWIIRQLQQGLPAK